MVRGGDWGEGQVKCKEGLIKRQGKVGMSRLTGKKGGKQRIEEEQGLEEL